MNEVSSCGEQSGRRERDKQRTLSQPNGGVSATGVRNESGFIAAIYEFTTIYLLAKAKYM